MANQQAPRDQNQVPTLLAVDDTTGETVPVSTDADGNILIAATVIGGGVTGPVTSTMTAIALWGDTTGDTLTDSSVLIDASSNVAGVGNVTGKSGGITVTGGTAASDDLTLVSTSNATKGYVILGSTSGVVFDQVNNRLAIGVDATENTVIVNGTTYGSTLTVHAEGATDVAEFSVHRHSNSAALGSHFIALRSRGTEATETVVQNNDVLSRLDSLGFDGTDYEIAAQIDVEVDGAPGNNDMPGRMVFKTTPNGSVTPTESFRIKNDQNIQIADGKAIQTAQSAGNTLLIQAYDVNGAAYTTFATLTANDTPTMDLSDSVTKSGGYIYRAGGTDVPVTDGGTGASTATAAFDNLAPTTTEGDIIYRGASNNVRLAKGTAGQVLTMNAGATAPEWAAASGGGTARRNMNLQIVASTYSPTGTTPTADGNVNGLNCSVTASTESSAARFAINSGMDLFDKDPEFNVTAYYHSGASTGSGKMSFGPTENNFSDTTPTQTLTALNMMIVADTASGTTTYYAVNGNGASNTNTSLTGIATGAAVEWRVSMTSGVNIKYYADYVLKATHTTNLPSGDPGLLFHFGVSNDSGDSTARQARFGYMDVLVNSPTG